MRRDLGGRRRGDRRPRPSVGHPLERHRVAGRRFIASGAASCPSSRRASTSATSAASSSGRSSEAAVTGAISARLRSRRARASSGSLLVGVSFAKAAAAAGELPLVGVHHLAGPHRVARAPERRDAAAGGRARRLGRAHEPLSGRQPGHYQLLSRTRDDAAGEAYDKVAKLLGLGYPGGPVVDRLARDRQRSRGCAADDAPDACRPQRAAS